MIIDLLAAIIITYGFYRGYNRGLIGTVVDTLSILIGLVIALKFSPLLITHLQEIIHIHPSFEFILGFLIVFFAVMMVLRFIADKIEDLLKTVKLNFINQLAGGLTLGFVFAFCCGGLLMLLSNLKVLNQEYASESTLFGHLVTLTQDSSWVFGAFKEMFSEFWDKFISTVDEVKQGMEQ